MTFDKFFLVFESKQNLINLGFPPVLSHIMVERYGNRAYTFGKWLKEHTGIDKKDWVYYLYIGRNNEWQISLELYAAANNNNPEEYKQVLTDWKFSIPEDLDEYYLVEQKHDLYYQIKDDFFNYYFFKNRFIQDMEGKTDIGPYKNLTFLEAEKRYEEKTLFADAKPIIQYPDGFKWIDAGSRCTLVGRMMKNCGSTGVMGTDPDRTMLVLFSDDNIAKVVVTYHPNEKKISGEQGPGSSAIKQKYHDYVLDLIDKLDVNFVADNQKSRRLAFIHRWKTVFDKIEEIYNGIWFSMFKVEKNNRVYYTDNKIIVNHNELAKVEKLLNVTIDTPMGVVAIERSLHDDEFVRKYNIQVDKL